MIAECDRGFHRIKGVFNIVHVCVLCVSGALGCCLFMCISGHVQFIVLPPPPYFILFCFVV